MGVYGAVFAGNPRASANSTDGDSNLRKQNRRANSQFGSQIDDFMKAAGTVTQTQAKTASYLQTLTSAFPQPPGSKTNTPSPASTSSDPQTGANQLQSAQSINAQTYNAERAEARRHNAFS